jgi:hypothetical protein
MKVLGTAFAALALAFSGSAMADRDDGRRYGGDRHYGQHNDYRGHYDDHRRHHRGHRHGHRGPQVSYNYYNAAPYYVAPPRYYGHRGLHYGSGVTIILPPIRFGY